MAKEKVQTAQQKFEAYVRLDEFMGNVDPKGILKDTASGAKGIVSTGDLQKLYENFPGSRLLAVKVPDHELIKLLRLVKEGTDKEVFAEADIRFEKVHVPTVHSIQTFVNIKRLSDTPGPMPHHQILPVCSLARHLRI